MVEPAPPPDAVTVVIPPPAVVPVPVPAPPVVVTPPPPPPPPNPYVHWGGGFRLTYSLPVGNAYEGQSLGGLASELFQIEWESDLIILQRVVIGGHIGIGLAPTGDDSIERLRSAR